MKRKTAKELLAESFRELAQSREIDRITVQDIAKNWPCLNARLLDSGFEGAREDLSLYGIKGILRRRFDAIDFDQAREDALPFIRNPSAVDVWSRDFFVAITEGLTAEQVEI